MPELSEDVVKAYDEFRSSELEQFHVWIRRQRAEQLRELLAQPSRLDLETFNHEVWALETATYLRGAKLAPGELGGKSFDSAWIADVRQAFADGELELHGNYMWGSGTKVFGAPLEQDDQEKLELVREALGILNGDASPLEKAERIIAIPGFGPNSATGLVMTYHPDEFQISNQVSKAVVAKFGFANTPLWAFEESVSAIRTALGAEDFLELDSFMYRQQQNGPVISLKDLTSAAAVTSALDEFDELGRESFLTKYGFAKARRYFVRRNGATTTRSRSLVLLWAMSTPRVDLWPTRSSLAVNTARRRSSKSSVLTWSPVRASRRLTRCHCAKHLKRRYPPSRSDRRESGRTTCKRRSQSRCRTPSVRSSAKTFASRAAPDSETKPRFLGSRCFRRGSQVRAKGATSSTSSPAMEAASFCRCRRLSQASQRRTLSSLRNRFATLPVSSPICSPKLTSAVRATSVNGCTRDRLRS